MRIFKTLSPILLLCAMALASLPAVAFGVSEITVGAGVGIVALAALLVQPGAVYSMHVMKSLQGGHVGGLEVKNFNINPADVPADPAAGMKFLAGKLGEIGTNFDQFKKANDEVLQQIKTKGVADPTLVEKVENLNKSIGIVQEMKDRVDAVEVALKRTAELTGVRPGDDSTAALHTKAATFWRNVRKQLVDPSAEDVKQYIAYRGALDKFVRFGEKTMTPDEIKTLYVGSQQDGGYLATPDLTGRMVTKIFETSPVRAVATVESISRTSLVGLYDLEETGADWEGELSTNASTTTPQIQRYEIPVHIMRARPRASQELLEDAETNVETWLGGKIGAKFGRTENTAFVTGNGVAKPRGFLAYPTATAEILPGAGTPTIQHVISGANGAFVAAPNAGDFLIDIIGSLKAAYLARARWAANRLTIAGIRKLKDSDGAYLWQPGITAGQPQSLLGYPLSNFEDMPTYTTTGALAIAFADWEETYTIVDRVGTTIQRDPYTQKPLIEFYARRRVGGQVLNFESIKLGKFSA